MEHTIKHLIVFENFLKWLFHLFNELIFENKKIFDSFQTNKSSYLNLMLQIN